MDIGDSSMKWLYRDQPQYEERRFGLPTAGTVYGFGGFGGPDPLGGGSAPE